MADGVVDGNACDTVKRSQRFYAGRRHRGAAGRLRGATWRAFLDLARLFRRRRGVRNGEFSYSERAGASASARTPRQDGQAGDGGLGILPGIPHAIAAMDEFYIRQPSGRTDGPYSARDVAALAAANRISMLGFVARVPAGEGYLRRDFVPALPCALTALATRDERQA